MTSVSNGKLPDMKTIAPNSPRLRAKERLQPAMNAGKIAGQIIRGNICQLLAPKDLAASSTSVATSSSTGCTVRIDKWNTCEHHGKGNAERCISNLDTQWLDILAKPAVRREDGYERKASDGQLAVQMASRLPHPTGAVPETDNEPGPMPEAHQTIALKTVASAAAPTRDAIGCEGAV